MCGELPKTATVSLSLPRSDSSIRKERSDEKIRSVITPCHLVRPYPAAISSSLLLIPGERGEKREKRGAEQFCAPLLWAEHDAYNRKRRSPTFPSNPLGER